jgi:antitoxin (DNA-binding transcriptional repressor) of toxin-antitoxin stability system
MTGRIDLLILKSGEPVFKVSAMRENHIRRKLEKCR